MRWNWKYAFITGGLLLIEILIALYVRDSFVRPFLGDFLVVGLLYFGFRTILKTNAYRIAIGVLIFAGTVELLQYFHLPKLLGLEHNQVARIILGSTFDWMDLLAYALGISAAVLIDKRLKC